MVKAEVKNLRRVKTGVWVGGKRYIFPAGVQVRMNLTDDMLRELQRNNAFSVKVISITSDNGNSAQKPSEDSVIHKESCAVPSENMQEDAKDLDPVDMAASDGVTESGTSDETSQEGASQESKESPKKEIFTMRKDELAAYLASKGIDPDGMSRKEMLKAAKCI